LAVGDAPKKIPTGLQDSLKAMRTKWEGCRPLVEATSNALKGNYPDAIRQTLSYASAHHVDFPPAVDRFVGLSVDLTQAKTGADVTAALENASAEVGSWRLKRANFFVLSISGLIGGAGGYESHKMVQRPLPQPRASGCWGLLAPM
jgi:hypothetical protein